MCARRPCGSITTSLRIRVPKLELCSTLIVLKLSLYVLAICPPHVSPTYLSYEQCITKCLSRLPPPANARQVAPRPGVQKLPLAPPTSPKCPSPPNAHRERIRWPRTSSGSLSLPASSVSPPLLALCLCLRPFSTAFHSAPSHFGSSLYAEVTAWRMPIGE
ncbi:hypothetical protein K466DRAFT_78573 [Polyporus arcularius HHB13444]|uniref:Uncharacterized protein n=1 Tax=Polyporus arcularius HHB13444 TaxID=1314778 RepID=A0A5C3NP31_9APHY|nr:hypothetical protein K466DRAFT_78573 [Polyporus arcularius HHB13444]